MLWLNFYQGSYYNSFKVVLHTHTRTHNRNAKHSVTYLSQRLLHDSYKKAPSSKVEKNLRRNGGQGEEGAHWMIARPCRRCIRRATFPIRSRKLEEARYEFLWIHLRWNRELSNSTNEWRIPPHRNSTRMHAFALCAIDLGTLGIERGARRASRKESGIRQARVNGWMYGAGVD